MLPAARWGHLETLWRMHEGCYSASVIEAFAWGVTCGNCVWRRSPFYSSGNMMKGILDSFDLNRNNSDAKEGTLETLWRMHEGSHSASVIEAFAWGVTCGNRVWRRSPFYSSGNMMKGILDSLDLNRNNSGAKVGYFETLWHMHGGSHHGLEYGALGRLYVPDPQQGSPGVRPSMESDTFDITQISSL